MSQLTLSFFGAFGARLGDKPLVNFRSAKAQGLLIYLALQAEQAHGRDVLAAVFWPDESETVAKHNLRQSLYRLRQLLNDTTSQQAPYLLVTRSTVQFNVASQYTLDVTIFLSRLESEQRESAIALYQDDLLPGFSCDSLPFDDWLRSERERHHRLALEAMVELTGQSLSQGDFQKAQRLARQQLTLEPWREEAHQQLMQALALSGDRSAALAQYETCRRVLEDELGLEPAVKTKTLATRIRDQQLEQQAQPQSDGPRRLTTPFVGRHREYEVLVKAYRQVSDNTLQVVSIVGHSGMGKTRLAQQFLAWAATQGADVLYGRSFESRAGLSYQPLIHLLRQRIERENAPDDLLSDLWLSQLTRLLPELRDRYPDLPEPTQEEATAKQHLFEAITRLGQALAERAPLVLFIDDWHWADTASLDVLQYTTQRWLDEGVPILVLLTLRQEALTGSPDLPSWLDQLKRTVSAVQLNLEALSQTETAQLVHMLLTPAASDDDLAGMDSPAPASPPQFSQWLFNETEGQPLFLAETLKALVEEGLIQPNATGTAWQIRPEKLAEQAVSGRILYGVRDIIQGWLARITPSASAVLTAASVLGQAASFGHLCRVAGLEEDQAIEVLDELLDKQLLLEAGAGLPADEALLWPKRDPVYSFSHQKVSEVVYAEVGTARRRLLHRRAFKTLQASEAAATECAHHAFQAGLTAETIRYSLIAGNEAMVVFAVRVAMAHYETVWQVAQQKGWPEEISGADRQALYTGLGRAYELVDDWTQAQETYQAMIDYARTIGATALECLGLNHLATVYLNGLDNRPQALELLEQARSLAEQSGDQRGLAETEWNLSMAAVHEQKPHLALQHGERAVAIARELKHPHLLARCLTSLGQAYAFLRQWEKAEAYVDETHQLYRAAGNLVMAANSQRGLGFIQIFSGRPAESLATLEETYTFSQQIENRMGLADCAWILARTHLELGNYGPAIRLGQQAVEQLRGVGPPLFHRLAQSAWGIVQRTIMAWDAAQKTLLDLFVNAPDEGVIGWTDQAPELCALYASVGDWEQASEYAKQVIRTPGNEPLLPFSLTGYYETEALLRGGEDDLARAEVERLREIVGDNKRYRLILLRSQTVLAQWDGDVAQAVTHLQAALALAQEIGLPGEEWPILAELGALYAERGNEAQSQQAYQDAAVIIHRLAETIDDEALRAGFLAAGPVRSVLEMSEGV